MVGKKIGMRLILLSAMVCFFMLGRLGYCENTDYVWGDAAANGLQLGIAMPQKTFSKKEPFIVKLAMRNTADKKVATPFGKNGEWLGIEFIATKNNEVSAQGASVVNGVNMGNKLSAINMGNDIDFLDEYIVLNPGEMISGDLDINDGLKGLSDLWNLGPGDYLLKAKFNYKYAEVIEKKTETPEGNTIIATKPAFEEFKDVAGESGEVNFTITE